MISLEGTFRMIGSAIRNVRARWALMTLYERFEQIVAIALSLVIAILIIIALVQLYERVVPLVLGGALAGLRGFEASARLSD
jgi:hypothetical protein